MTFFVHWTVGLVVSYLAAIPMGPVNVAIIQTALNHGQRHAFRIAVGSAFIEALYCLAAVGGLQLIFGATASGEKAVFEWIKIASAPLLLGLGFFNLLKKNTDTDNSPKTPPNYHGFWLGFFLNLINPGLLPLWVGVSGFLLSVNLIDKEFSSLFFYSVGAGVGTFLLHYSVAVLAARYQPNLSHRRKTLINRLVGLFFMGFGLYITFTLICEAGYFSF